MITLDVNGRSHQVDADPTTPLLWVLREQLGLTGAKYGCGQGLCGSCTVHLDGEAAQSCKLPVAKAAGKKITTIEGLAGDRLRKLRDAWLEHDVSQCGYCQPGVIMAVAALLTKVPNPTDADIDASITNICRCGSYQQVRAAIHTAAKP
jgi:isoquinoline 1-oxidoreductase alpha subunit